MLAWVSLLIVYVVWGSTYMGIKLVVAEMPPFAAAALRFGAAGAVMALVAFVTRRGRGRPTRRQVLDYAFVGVLLLAGGNALVMWSQKRLPSGIAALIVATVPLWMTLFDGLREGGERWTLRVWLGTLLGLLGAGLVARPSGSVGAGHWPAVIALTIASVSWSAGALYSQAIRNRLPVVSASAIQMLAGAFVLFLESRLCGEELSLIGLASSRAWLGLGYLAVFGSLVGFTAFAHCLNELPSSIVGTYAYVNPVVAVTLGALFLGEPLTHALIAGGVLIVGAVVITTLRPRAARAAPATSAQLVTAGE